MAGVVAVDHPDWITNELLARILLGNTEEPTEENRVEVYQVKADRAVAKGENFSSDIRRISVKYTKGHKKGFKFAFLIFKSDLVQELKQDCFQIFLRERACYETILPRVYGMLRSVGDDTCKLSPECFRINETHHPRYFVFEDLKHCGYVNVDRRVGLDVRHMELAFKKLAKWHAATAQLAQVDPATMEKHQFRNVCPDVNNFHAFFEKSMRTAGETIKTWPGCEVYGEKLQVLADSIIAKCCDVFTKDINAFNVLNHGDVWLSNIMFKNDPEGRPTDAVFVDYAVGYYGSPGIDLSYLLFTSNAETNTEDDWDALLRLYHTELVANLKKLGYIGKLPSLLDIYIEYLRKSYYGMMISLFVIPLRLIDDTENSDLGNLLGIEPKNIAFRKMLFGTPKYRDFIEPLLKFWDRKGLLDE